MNNSICPDIFASGAEARYVVYISTSLAWMGDQAVEIGAGVHILDDGCGC